MAKITPRLPSSHSMLIALMALCLIFAAGFASLYAITHTKDTAEPSAPNQHKTPQKTFNAAHYKLDNGLEIIVIPNHRAPVVTHMVWYKVGAADENAGQSGIAHFLEHLMFKGTKDMPPGEFSKTIRALGGHDNAFTSQDYTAYYQSIAAEHLSAVMAMEAGRMRGLAPPPEDVISERDVILEERRQRIDTSPIARFKEHLRAAAFTNHPYGTPIIGWFHEMENLTWDMAHAFYNKHYGPNNAILIVAGDVTGDQVLALAQEHYGQIKPIALAPRTRTVSPPLSGQITLTETTQDVQQGQITILYCVPSYAQNPQTSLALDLIQEILSGGSSSRLYQDLVTEQKLATAIDFSYNSAALNDGTVTITAYIAPDTAPQDLIDAIEESLQNLINDGVTQSELKTAKQKAQDAAVFAPDSLTGPAMIIGQSLTTGANLDDVEYWPANIAKISQDAIQKTAATYLDKNAPTARIVYGIITPPHAIAKASGSATNGNTAP